MLQADIDLLEQQSRDSYFFAIRLISLSKNKKKQQKHAKNSHFKFVLEQNHYVIDQTRTPIQNIFWLIRTTIISLNKQLLQFSVPDITHTNTQFELKLYTISHQQVNQLAQMNIQTLTYVEVFLECGKTVFRQTASICPEYTLEYEIYVHKTEIDLSNLIKDNDEEVFGLKNAFKKKTNQVIEIENQKVEIKPKRRDGEEKNLLRKSLYVNVNKLMEIKKRNQEIKEKSISKEASRSSFFTQIGDIFRARPSQIGDTGSILPKLMVSSLNASQNKSNQSKHAKKDSQRSFSLSTPWIDHSKYKNDQTASQQDSLKILRQKQRQRVRVCSSGAIKWRSSKFEGWKMYLRVFTVIMLIIVLALVVYYLSSGKRGRYKLWKSVEAIFN